MEEKKVTFGNFQKSAFGVDAIDSQVESIKNDIKGLYKSDNLPWVIGLTADCRN